MLPVRNILHPTDFSEHSDYAYRVARLIADDCRARLIVLHVAGIHGDGSPAGRIKMSIPQIMPCVYLGYHAVPQRQLPDRSDPTGDFLRERRSMDRQLHNRFNRNHTAQVETRLEDGDAAEEIIRLSEKVACDLIVMGTHGRSGMGRLIMGSVAEQVMRKAHCPVLTVKNPVPAQLHEPSESDWKSTATADLA